MSSKIYGKLAITNLKNNRKTYVPYILMAVLSVMMYYIVGGMAQGNNGLSQNVKMIMGYMNGLLMIFSVIFLFYTNSFLIKLSEESGKSGFTIFLVWEKDILQKCLRLRR